MITIYKTMPEGLIGITHFEASSWIDVAKPSRQELEELAEKLNLPLEILTTPLDADERPRVEKWEEDQVLIIVRTPIENLEDPKVPFYTVPIGIILTKDMVITICSKEDTVLKKFIEGKVKRFETDHKGRFIIQVMYEIAIIYLKYLRMISNRMYELEEEVHGAVKNEKVIQLLGLEKSLVYFTTSLRANDIMFEKLQKANFMQLSENDRELLDDTITETKQAIEMVNIYSNILSGLMNAFTSIISNNLNVVMKRLTEVTLIIMIPTLITSMFGMNVGLPYQDKPHMFLAIILGSFILSITVYLIVKKRWFWIVED